MRRNLRKRGGDANHLFSMEGEGGAAATGGVTRDRNVIKVLKKRGFSVSLRRGERGLQRGELDFWSWAFPGTAPSMRKKRGASVSIEGETDSPPSLTTEAVTHSREIPLLPEEKGNRPLHVLYRRERQNTACRDMRRNQAGRKRLLLIRQGKGGRHALCLRDKFTVSDRNR